MEHKAVVTEKAPAAIGPYSQAVIYRNIVYTSGQIPICPESGEIEAKDIEGQTHQVMKNISAILESCGSSMKNIIKTTCFLADMKDFSAFNEVYAKYMVSKPARSCSAANCLPKNSLLEVEAIAYINPDTASDM